MPANVRVGFSPGANLYVPSGSWGTMSWDKQYFGSAGTRNPSYPSRLYAPATDIYYISAEVSFNPQSGGSKRVLSIVKNGSIVLALNMIPPQLALGQPADHIKLFTIEKLNGGDYVELLILQDSGVNMYLITGETVGNQIPTFSMASQ